MAYDDIESEDSSDTEQMVGALSLPQMTSTPEAKEYSRRILDQGLNVKDQTPDLLADLSKNAEAARQVLREARQRLLARKSQAAAEQLLAMSAGFGTPSRNFGETMGNVSSNALKVHQQQDQSDRQGEDDRLKLELGLTGVDDSLLKNRLALLSMQTRNKSGLMSQALKTLAAASGIGAKPGSMSPYGKIAKDEGLIEGTPQFIQRVSQLRSQDLAVKRATSGLDAPDESSGSDDEVFNRLGVPKSPVDPYAGLSTKAALQVRQAETKNAEKTLDSLAPSVEQAQQGIQDVDRFVKLNRNQPSGGAQGSIPVLGDIASWATGFSANAKEMDAITSRMSRHMRVPGEGSTSDFDAKQFIKGTIGRDKPYQTNKNIAAGYRAQQQRILDRADFFNNYMLANGHLRGAQSEWMRYLNANPIFDSKKPGAFKLNEGRQSYQNFFKNQLQSPLEEDPTQGGEYPYAEEAPKQKMAEGGEVESDDHSDLLRSILQGATFGMGDEGLAALQSTPDKPLEQNLKSERGKVLESQNDSPLTSMLGSATGSTATLVALGKLIAKSKGLTDAALRLVPERELIKLALTGATAGAAMGFGSGEDSDRISSSLQTSALGSGLGVLGGLAAKYGISGAEGLIDRVRGNRISGAEKRLATTLGEDTRGVSGPISDVTRLRRSGVPATLLDTGGAKVQALGAAAASRNGPEGEALVQDLADRGAGTRERVGEKINKALKPDEYFGKMQDLQKALYSNAQPLYEAAYKAFPSISSNTLMGILQTPDGQKALRMGLRLAGNRQMGISPEDLQSQELTPLQKLEKEAKDQGLFQSEETPTPEQSKKEMDWLKNYKAAQEAGETSVEKVAPGLPLELFDYIKRGFDQNINDTETKGPNTLGHSIRGLRNRLRGELDTVTAGANGESPYAAARQQYAGDLEVLDALKSGREDFNSMTPEEIKRKVADMSFSEKDAFRSGVAQHLFEKINGPTSDINAARRVIGSPSTAEKLRPLFETQKQFDLFKTALDTEMDMFDKSKRVVSRAASSGVSQAGKSESLLEKLDPGLHSTPWGWTPTTWALNLLRQTPTMSNETAEGISKALRTTDPSDLRALSQRLENVSARLKGRAKRAGKAGVVGAAITGMLTAPSPKGKNLEEETADGEE